MHGIFGIRTVFRLNLSRAPVIVMQNVKATYKFFETAESDRRLGELILYIASRSMADPKYGKTKLNKILYFADTLAYLRFGKPISGAEYMRLPHGPAPKRMLPVLEVLERNGSLAIQETAYFGQKQERPLALRDADLDLFSGNEISIVDRVIEMCQDHNASELSLISHNRAWHITPNKDSIPYEAAFISDEAVTDYDLLRAKELSDRYGWNVSQDRP